VIHGCSLPLEVDNGNIRARVDAAKLCTFLPVEDTDNACVCSVTPRKIQTYWNRVISRIVVHQSAPLLSIDCVQLNCCSNVLPHQVWMA